MTVRVCLDNISYTSKREAKRDIKCISARISRQEQEVELEQLAYNVGERGNTFCPAIFNGKRENKNFKQMQVFCLDFDDGSILFDEVLARCHNFHIPVAFGYETFSSSEALIKYRVGFVHCVPITNADVAIFILRILLKIFPEADKSCKDVARMFFGGKRVIHLNTDDENTFRVDTLANCFQTYNREYNFAHFISSQEALVKGLETIGLLEYGFFNICTYIDGRRVMGEFQEDEIPIEQKEKIGEKSNNSIKYILELFDNSQKIVFCNYPTYRASRCRDSRNYLIKNISKDIVSKRCRLWKEFAAGEHLTHDERFLLATNILYIKGMDRLFLEITGKYYESQEDWKHQLKYCYAQHYNPMSCLHCPYENECLHETNLVQTVSGRKSIVRIKGLNDYISTEEGYREVKHALMTAIQANDQAIHLIKAQTSIGKTHAYEELLCSGISSKPIIIAVPLVSLKEEIARRLSGAYINEVVSLTQLTLSDDVKERVTELYRLGYYKEAKKLIADYEKTVPDSIEKERLHNYLHWREVLEKHDSNIVMTHAQLMNVPEDLLKHFEVIIDEDYLYTILRGTGQLSREALEKLIYSGNVDEYPYSAMLTALHENQKRYFRKQQKGFQNYIAHDEMSQLRIYEDVNSFLNADVYLCEDSSINYYSIKKLPQQKLTILSATLDKDIYELFYKDRPIVFHELQKSKYRGKLIQYTNHSLSRKDIRLHLSQNELSAEQFYQHLKACIGDFDYGITFKEYEQFLGNNYLHFGNAIGLDKYKGKTGLIVGTPHLPETCYKLLGFYLGVDVTNCKLERRRVQYGDFEFPLMSYENDTLRKLQLYMISSDLEQCIGRSRLLRTNATVYLFSNFPCEQAEIIQEDYLPAKKVSMPSEAKQQLYDASQEDMSVSLKFSDSLKDVEFA